MMDKIKAFFSCRSVKIAEGLIIGFAAYDVLANGINADGLARIITMVFGGLVAVEAIITVIQGIATK